MHLTDENATAGGLLAWIDPGIERYIAQCIHVASCLSALERYRAPQASHARRVFKAELTRVERELVVDRTSELEAAREAYRIAVDACHELAAREPAETIDDEVRRSAERALFWRRAGAAKLAFVQAALASQLPPLGAPGGPNTLALAEELTREIVALARKHPPSSHEIGYVHAAVDCAHNQGRDFPPEHAHYLAVAEAEYAGEPEAEAVFAERWLVMARRLGLPEEPAVAAAE